MKKTKRLKNLILNMGEPIQIKAEQWPHYKVGKEYSVTRKQ